MNANLSDVLGIEFDDIDDLQAYGLDPDTLLSQVKQFDRHAVRSRIVDRHMREYSEERSQT